MRHSLRGFSLSLSLRGGEGYCWLRHCCLESLDFASNWSTGSRLSSFNKRTSSKSSNWDTWARKARTYVHIYIYIYIYIYLFIYTHNNMYTYMLVCIYIYIYIYTHMYIYIYMYIHIHICLSSTKASNRVMPPPLVRGPWRRRAPRWDPVGDSVLTNLVMHFCGLVVYIYIYIYRERERERDRCVYTNVYICIYIYIYTYIHMFIYIDILCIYVYLLVHSTV